MGRSTDPSKALVIDADSDETGDGTLTIAHGKTADSNDSLIEITAWDIDLQGYINAGNQVLKVHGSVQGQGIGFGWITSRDMHLSNLELTRITALGGLHVGGQAGGFVDVGGVNVTNVQNIELIASVVALKDDFQIGFSAGGSTFYALAAQADNGVVVTVDITSDTDGIYLDGDVENSSSEDGTNTVGFTDGRTVTAKTVLTLEASQGRIEPAGELTLNAGTGVTILDNLLSKAVNQTLVVDADYELHGDGMLTVWAGKTVDSNNGDIHVTPSGTTALFHY